MTQTSLLDTEGTLQDKGSVLQPLAARMRPKCIDEYIGQQHLCGENGMLRRALAVGSIPSIILWGPPGTGKTTLAHIIATELRAKLELLSAVSSGIKEIRAVIESARQRSYLGEKTLLFVDEVHRFNKAQQDAFLPHIEDGTVIFIGATTENPSFEVNNALLSRARVLVLKPLSQSDIEQVLRNALVNKERGIGIEGLRVDDEVISALASLAQGDARSALNMLESCADWVATDQLPRICLNVVEQIVQGSLRRFDKGGDLFYEQISALHKAVRGSSPDAALYWMSRMLDGGCDPLYIARRVVRMATEDIGLADPRALSTSLDAWQTLERLGAPEGLLALSQAIVYLSIAPKSNAVYSAHKDAMRSAQANGDLDVPVHLRNAPTSLLKSLNYGGDYRYAHDHEGAYVAGESYFPEMLHGDRYYIPTDRGLEKKIAEKLEHLSTLDDKSVFQRYEQGNEKIDEMRLGDLDEQEVKT